MEESQISQHDFITLIEKNDLEGIEELVKNRADMDETIKENDYGIIVYGLTPIMVSIYFKREKALQLLLDLGADPNKKSLYVGKDITGRDKAEPQTPIEYAFGYALTDKMKTMIGMLKKAGAKLTPDIIIKYLRLRNKCKLKYMLTEFEYDVNQSWTHYGYDDMLSFLLTDNTYSKEYDRLYREEWDRHQQWAFVELDTLIKALNEKNKFILTKKHINLIEVLHGSAAWEHSREGFIRPL